MSSKFQYLKQLESEAIHIFREIAASFQNPVILYSVGKDSSVLLRLAQKAFHPGPIPFPLMHIDTGLKFPEMYQFRDQMVESIHAKLIVEHSQVADQSCHPVTEGIDRCCAVLKTQGLLGSLQKHGFDAAVGGARRDEEKSRAKERIFSIRDEFGQWNPKDQRPEIWNLYNTNIDEKQSARIFPLSNWTEKDVWQYIVQENIPVVPLYFAKERTVIDKGGVLIPKDHSQTAFLGQEHGGVERIVSCRFRSLGCIPCTGAVESTATTVEEIIEELFNTKTSERQSRLIDHTSDASMEQKKKEGYF